MVVTSPPRLQGSDESREHAEFEALREQALIEEARRRARRRRRGYGGITAFIVAIAVGIGFAHTGGGGNRTPARGSARAPVSGAAINGDIAVADGSGTLRIASPDGSRLRTIARCSAADVDCRLFEPAWSPDGTQLAYVRGRLPHFPHRGFHELSLYVTDLRGGRARRLAACGDCGVSNRGRLAWSPDGTTIAFTRDSTRARRQSLWSIGSAGGRLHRLTNCASTACIDVQPAWGPNGQLIVFSRIGSRDSGLYTIRRNGTHLTKATTVPGAIDPNWSPDGRLIAFDSGDDIYLADLASSQVRRLVAGSGAGSGPGAPSWSPDGTRVVFFNTPSYSGFFRAEVWTINPDGSARQRLARTRCCVESWAAPVWSPDSKKIAFAASSAGGTFVVNAAGGGLHRLTPATAVALAWRRVR